MFDAITYKERRQLLKKEIREGIILLPGNEESGINYADNWYHFRQDSSFLYYCGLEKTHLILLIDIDKDQEILFGDDPAIDDIVWTGPVPSLNDLAKKSGIPQCKPYEEVLPFIQNASGRRKIHFLPPYRPEHILKLMKWFDLPREKIITATSQCLIQAVIKQRSIKTEEEIIQIEEAVSMTKNIHLEAMRCTRIGMKEYEVMSHVHKKVLDQGGNLAFPIILTKNGHILHNHGYESNIKEGDLILCDAGVENSLHYAGDLTRTFPAGKRFTGIQRDLYAIVLAAQLAAIEAMKPGVLFKDIHLTACRKLAEGLKSIGLMKGNPEDAVDCGAHTLFFQCGLGHMMGLDVHDMENLGEEYVGYTSGLKQSTEFGLKSLRLGRTLEAGFVVTVEPGIYIIPELINLWRSRGKYTDFVYYDRVESLRHFGGIRIEDDFVITKNGSRLLGNPLPKKIKTIETIREEELS